MPELQFEYSSWLVLVCLLLGSGYAALLYTKKNPWSKAVNRILAGLRFLVVGFILILILNPLLKQLVRQIEQPVVVVAVDDSSSIINSTDSLERAGILNILSRFASEMEANGFDVTTRSLTQSSIDLGAINFIEKTTDLNTMFRDVETLFDGKNLHSLLLVSDGNYNRGISPVYFPYGFTINTVGIGDTTSTEDLILKNVLYNKIAYEGNRFPLVAEVINYGFEGGQAKVRVLKNGKNIAEKSIQFGSATGLSQVEFEIEAKQSGVQHYVVIVETSDEEIIVNNEKDIFIDVIDGKQNILLIAPSPHPDIKALRSTIIKNENYEFTAHIPGSSDFKKEKYDLVLIHQAGDRSNRLESLTKQFEAEKIPILYILGQQSDVNSFYQNNPSIEFKSIRNQRDEVSPALNINFPKFKINPDFSQIFSQYPTVNVAYGDMELNPDASVILYQKVGSITTDKPLLFVENNQDTKTGFLLADGIWQWRLQEYAVTENTEAFDDIFLKVVQYLCTKDDRRKFRVLAEKDEFFDNGPVSLSVEVYNDNYERVFGDVVRFKVYDEDGRLSEYTFTSSESNSEFHIGGLVQGTYRYEALLESDGKVESSSGRFTVKKLQLELLDQVANYELLQQIADNTNGKFYTQADFDQLIEDLTKTEIKSKLHLTEDFFAMINLKLLFFFLLILLSVEWFTRKYSGGY